MNDSVEVGSTQIPYIYKKNRRSKSIKLAIDRSGQITLTSPWYTPKRVAVTFLNSRISWIQQALSQIQAIPKAKTYTASEITEMKIKTRDLVRDRIAYFNNYYKYTYQRITIRNQKTRWGSCSANKTLSFNCKLCLLPAEVADYVIVHELCHLKEMNHAPAFWKLVGLMIPNYRSLRKQLHQHSISL